MPGGVAFFGYGELGLAGLQTLLSIGAPVSNVIVPANRSGPGIDLVREAAARCAVPLLVQPPRRAIAPFVDTLRSVRPDLIIVCSYSMMLPPPVLAVPAKGAVNVHGGLLPHYRGGHVTQWAIINAEREFGVTLHYIDEGVDTGPVIAERRFTLDEADDAYSVGAKLCEAGSQLLTTWWQQLIDGTAPRVPQDESRAKVLAASDARGGSHHMDDVRVCHMPARPRTVCEFARCVHRIARTQNSGAPRPRIAVTGSSTLNRARWWPSTPMRSVSQQRTATC